MSKHICILNPLDADVLVRNAEPCYTMACDCAGPGGCNHFVCNCYDPPD